MRTCQLAFVLILLGMAEAFGATPPRDPHIGYVYPAGGQRGTTFEVQVGGQYLRAASDVYVSGGGIRARAVKHYVTRRFIPQEQRQALQKKLVELRDAKLAELEGSGSEGGGPGTQARRLRAANAENGPNGAEGELPDHPLVRNLEDKSLRELRHVADMLLDWRIRRKQQPNAQIGEIVLIEVTIDPGAAPGDRELRLVSPRGVTNPLPFQVGVLPEVVQREPDEPDTTPNLPEEPPVELPAVLNGQILPGDVDRFRFRARAGQNLVIETRARRLVPFLADAVPGWFQATVALYDADGRELLFADDYRFSPDPVVLFEVPEDGVYELEIRDAIYRGREDFVYRVSVGETPFVTSAFPLGGHAVSRPVASVEGWNLPSDTLRLKAGPADSVVREAALRAGNALSNDIHYAVDMLPEFTESEPNDSTAEAEPIELPRIVNGRISSPDDADVFRFEGAQGDEVVADVLARRLHSPLDAVVRIMDADGKVVAWNDDHMVMDDGYLHPDMGTLTHHADPYLRTVLPADGTYYVKVADVQRHGGSAYAYRLRLSPPQPDFTVRATPSALTMFAGRSAPFTVHVQRREGFDGDVEVSLRDPTTGFRISGGRVPAGRESVRMTLTAPFEAPEGPVNLQLEGNARINGKVVTHVAVPCENMMQAFLWRHLVPVQEFVVAVRPTRWFPIPALPSGPEPVTVASGSPSPVLLRTGRRPRSDKVELQPIFGSEGFDVGQVRVLDEGLEFQVRVDPEAEPGTADNLIVEAFIQVPVRNAEGEVQEGKTRRASLGVLPAVPFVVGE